MNLDDARDALHSVDAELDHGRVLRVVRAERRPRRWTAPLAAAVAVACVLLTTVGALAWVAAQDLPGPAQPATAPPPVDPDVLAERVARAVARAEVVCVRVLDGGAVIAEQLREVGTGRAVYRIGTDGRDWPGCGPEDGPTRAPTYDGPGSKPGPKPGPKLLVAGDVLAPLTDRRYHAAAATDGVALVGEGLRFVYVLEPGSERPTGVRLSGLQTGSAELRWFAADSDQARFVLSSRRPLSGARRPRGRPRPAGRRRAGAAPGRRRGRTPAR